MSVPGPAAMVIITAVSIGIFLLMFRLAGVVSIARAALSTLQGAIKAMRDPALEELARERAVRSAAVSLVTASGSLVLRSLAALVAAFIPILIADGAGIVARPRMIAFMERWDVILVATVAVTLGYFGVRAWRR